MKLFTIFSFVFLSTFVFEGALSAQIDNDYWIVVPANYNPTYSSIPDENSPRLTLLAENPTTVTVKAASTTYTVNANQAGYTIPTPMPMIPQHKGKLKRAIHAYSLDGLPFHVQLGITPEEWGEGTWCIPTHSLGKMYRIVGYKASNVNIHPAAYDTTKSIVTPEFAIVATKDNTQVTIDFPPGKNLASITITMNAGDAYHIDCGKPDVNIDPTGTRITASQPIAVFSGQANADIGGTGYGNALMEQMFPIESWGKLHNIVADPLQSGDVYRFVADCDGTQISLDGTVIATIDAGKFYEVTISGAHEICSTKPIEVAKFTRGGTTLYSDQGGPSMLVIPPVGCYFDSSRFYQLDIASVAGKGVGIGVPGVVVICPTAYTPLVLFDGSAVNGFLPIPNSCSTIQYSWTYVPIATKSEGAHTLWYSTPPTANPYSLYGYYTAQDGDRDENLEWNVGYRSRIPSLQLGNLDLGTLICDTTKTVPIKLSNVGNAPLVISSMSGVAAPFTISGITLPDTILPGDSVKATVTFASSTAGTYMQTLAFATNEVGICGPPIDTLHIEARKERAAITSAPSSHDFGDVYCQDYETTISVTNVGTVDAQVTDSTFSQAGLEIISPSLPVTIAPGNTQQFTIRLHSSVIPVGTYSSTLHLIAEPCDLSCDFQLTANRKALAYNVSPAVKDFGITNVNKTSSGTFTFDNQSDVAVHIAGAQFDNAAFSVTTTFGQTVAPHSSLAIDFTCYPSDTLKYESTLTINIDSPCVGDRKVLVRVEGASVCPQVVPTEVIGAVPGEIATIPIIVDPSTKLSSTQKIDVRVKYDADLLRYGGDPVPAIGMNISGITPLPDGVSFTITTNGLPIPQAEIARIKVQALLSTHADGAIDVSSSTFTLKSGEQITGGSCPVPFLLGESCVKPGDLKPRSSATIEGIYPNPIPQSGTGATIVINAYGIPHVLIDVFDMFGRKVETVADGLFTSGHHDIMLDAARYTNGIYFCRMVASGIIVTKEFNVRK